MTIGIYLLHNLKRRPFVSTNFMEISEYLRQLGLNEKEDKVYLVCLELGESTITLIFKKSGYPKTTVYFVLEKLEEKGLIEIFEHNNKFEYVPNPPKSLVGLFKEKQAKLQDDIEGLEKVIPELNQLYGRAPFQPKARLFNGQEELRKIYEEILEMPIDEEWYVGETSKIVEALGVQYLKNWITRRVKKKIRSKSIRVRSEEAKEPEFVSKEYLRQVRYAPADFRSPTHILIYGDNVAIITTREENFGLVVTSREYASTMKSWFEQLWRVSGK